MGAKIFLPKEKGPHANIKSWFACDFTGTPAVLQLPPGTEQPCLGWSTRQSHCPSGEIKQQRTQLEQTAPWCLQGPEQHGRVWAVDQQQDRARGKRKHAGRTGMLGTHRTVNAHRCTCTMMHTLQTELVSNPYAILNHVL